LTILEGIHFRHAYEQKKLWTLFVDEAGHAVRMFGAGHIITERKPNGTVLRKGELNLSC
jgi:hypothetical protein